jgi:hypothetical protein
MSTCHSVVLYIHCLSCSVLTVAVECDQIFINHTNECTFDTYKYILILLLHVFGIIYAIFREFYAKIYKCLKCNRLRSNSYCMTAFIQLVSAILTLIA